MGLFTVRLAYTCCTEGSPPTSLDTLFPQVADTVGHLFEVGTGGPIDATAHVLLWMKATDSDMAILPFFLL